MPDTGADVAAFIDAVGMPLTPLSYAGTAAPIGVEWRNPARR